MLLKNFLFLFLINSCVKVSAQKMHMPDSLRQVVFAARYHSGFIFAHNIHVQNTKGTHPDGIEIEYSHLHTDSSTLAKFKCYSRNGFSFTYTDYNKEFLGKAYSVSYFLEPNYRLGNRLRACIRGSAGFSYLTNPFDPIKNPANQSYSGHINTFLQVDAGLSYAISNHLAVYAMGNFFHDSNGGFKEPNAGVNYVNASVGLQYYTYSTRLPVYRKQKDTLWKHQSFHINAALYYSPKDGYHIDSVPARKFVLGASLQIVKQVGPIDALTAAAEVYYDDGLRSIKRIFIQDSSSNVLAGVLIGHQFLLNRFSFTQELGVYVVKQTALYNSSYRDLYHSLYQRWGLYYKFSKNWSAGINLLAHYQIADFIDARIIYRLK